MAEKEENEGFWNIMVNQSLSESHLKDVGNFKLAVHARKPSNMIAAEGENGYKF